MEVFEVAKVTVTMTWERLAAMDDNGNRLYATPGAIAPYWGSSPSFTYDEQVATVYDFRTDYGAEYERDQEAFESGESFSVEVELPGPRQ
jgi:hypothetical protein